MYYHCGWELLLIVYVDVMKLSGPTKHMNADWEALEKGIALEEPKGNAKDTHTFLGCEHNRYTKVINGKEVQCIDWNVVHSIDRCLAKYEEAVLNVLGQYPRLHDADTPFVHDETKFAKCRLPWNSEDFVECPSCLDTFPQSVIASDHSFTAGTKRPLHQLRHMIGKTDCTFFDDANVDNDLCRFRPAESLFACQVDSNHEDLSSAIDSDAITNGYFTWLNPLRRMEAKLDDLPFIVLPKLLKEGALFYNDMDTLNVGCPPVAKPKRLLKIREPWD